MHETEEDVTVCDWLPPGSAVLVAMEACTRNETRQFSELELRTSTNTRGTSPQSVCSRKYYLYVFACKIFRWISRPLLRTVCTRNPCEWVP